MNRAPRIALLTNAPAPYRTAFFNELGKRSNLLLVFDTKREPDRSWLINEADFGFDWCVTRGLMVMRPRIGRVVNRRVLHVPLNTLAILKRFRPDVVVSDELGIRTMWAALYCQMRRRPLIIWWEGIPHSDGTGRFRTLRRTVLLRYASRIWGNGVGSAQSLARYGVPAERVDLGMTGMDTVSWRSAVDHQRAAIRTQVRTELGLRGAVLLFVGRLEPIKGVTEFLAALTAVAAILDLPSWSALFVGAGPSSRDVTQWAEAHPEITVVLTGFVQPEALPKYHAAADLFVLPSLEEPWGLVCLEALVSGLPQVTSSMAGSALDLIMSSEIGDIIDPRDTQVFAEHLASRIRQAPVQVPDDARANAVTTWSPSVAATRGMAGIHRCLDAESPTSPTGGVTREATGPDGSTVDAVVTVSVDDGFPSDRRAAAMLADLGYLGTFYVPAHNPERPVMSIADIRAIAEQFEIGAHTYNHVPLTRLDHDAASREIADGKAWLEDITATHVASFCYPRGKFTPKLARMVRTLGFTGARTTMGNIVSRPMDPYLAGATTQAFSHSRMIQLRHAALEGNWRGMFNYATVFRFATDWTEHFEHGVRYVTTYGGVAHLWFHSWELDAYDKWDTVEELLRRLRSDYQFRVATNGDVFANS